MAPGSGIAGVTLISCASSSGPGGPGGPGEPDAYGVAGAVLALTASGAAAGGSVTLKRIGAGCPLLTVAAWQLIVGSLPLLAASSVLEAGATVVWNAATVGLLLFLALVGASSATALWYRLLQSSEVGELTLFLFLVPLVGLAVAAAAFREPLRWLEVGGALLTVAGIGATTRERSRSRPG